MAAKGMKKMNDDDVKKFQKELKEFVEKKLGERPYQCMICYIAGEEAKGKGKSIITNLTTAGNINSEMPFMVVNSIFQNLANGVRRLGASFYGKMTPPEEVPAEKQLKQPQSKVDARDYR